MNRIVSGLVIEIFMFLSMVVFAFNVQPARAQGTIYITPNGQVVPSTAPFRSVNNTDYTFTSNIDDSIVIERDNITVDGAGYVVQGVGTGGVSYCGIELCGRRNVTIQNMKIEAFGRARQEEFIISEL